MFRLGIFLNSVKGRRGGGGDTEDVHYSII